MNIAFLIDDTYSEQLAATLVSILKNDRHNTDFNIYVLDTGISEENKEKICKLKEYKPFNIEFIKIESSIFEDFPTIYHLKSLNYARIILPQLVQCSKILFMDCDLLVLDDLSDFYNTEFDNNYACAVRERLSDEPRIQRQIKKLGVKKYFNAGVMLLNLEKMRQDSIVEKALNFVREHPEKILLLDQDVLNYAFSDRVRFVNNRWNYQFKLNLSPKPHKPAIIHFVGWEKPFFGFAHPYENLYYSYLKLTPFRVSFLNFKYKMWKMFYPKFKQRICVLIKSMLS